MYIRHILRRQFVGTRAVQFSRLQHVFRAEVAALKINRLFILMNICFSLTAAETFHNTCPTCSGGGCGKPTVSHHQHEVWLLQTRLRCYSVWFYAVITFIPPSLSLSCHWPLEITLHQKWWGEAGGRGQQEVRLSSSNHLLQSHWQKHPCRYYLWRRQGKQSLGSKYSIYLIWPGPHGIQRGTNMPLFSLSILNVVYVCSPVFGI